MSRQGRTGPAGDARTQEQMRAAEKVVLAQREADLKALLALPAGRRFLWDLIDRRCNAHGTALSWSGSEMYWLNGQRSVGVDLRVELEAHDPDNYLLMLQESLVEAANQRLRKKTADSKATTEMDGE
jgi:hypothetical protein